MTPGERDAWKWGFTAGWCAAALGLILLVGLLWAYGSRPNTAGGSSGASAPPTPRIAP